VTVTGLAGGHSGLDIDKGRGNAIKLLVRLLRPAGDSYGVRLASLQGGRYHNAIPTEANALIMLPANSCRPFGDYLKKFETTMRSELAAAEPNVAVKWITATVAGPPLAVMTPLSQNQVLNALYANPQGVLRMSDSVPGLVETSNNLGVVRTADGLVKASNLARSSVDSELTDAGETVMSVWDLAGGQSTITDRYPGWTPNPDSPLLSLFMQTYEQLHGPPRRAGVRHDGQQVSEDGLHFARPDAARRALCERAAAGEHGAPGR
jgi:dipeptidase D